MEEIIASLSLLPIMEVTSSHNLFSPPSHYHFLRSPLRIKRSRYCFASVSVIVYVYNCWCIPVCPHICTHVLWVHHFQKQPDSHTFLSLELDRVTEDDADRDCGLGVSQIHLASCWRLSVWLVNTYDTVSHASCPRYSPGSRQTWLWRYQMPRLVRTCTLTNTVNYTAACCPCDGCHLSLSNRASLVNALTR